MRARATFDCFSHHLSTQHLSDIVAVVADWARSATALTTRITRVSWGWLPRSIWDSVRMRTVSKVITSTAREPSLEWTGNLVAAPRVQATEPQTGFHMAQSSYGTELWAAAASPDSNADTDGLCSAWHASRPTDGRPPSRGADDPPVPDAGVPSRVSQASPGRLWNGPGGQPGHTRGPTRSAMCRRAPGAMGPY